MRGGASRSYSIFFRSVWQMPQASTRTSISPAPIVGVGTSSTETTDRPLYTAADIASGTTRADTSASEAAVSNKLPQRLGGYGAPFPEFDQLRTDGARARDRGRENPRRTETAVRSADGIEVDM